jgi:hypothetical protein
MYYDSDFDFECGVDDECGGVGPPIFNIPPPPIPDFLQKELSQTCSDNSQSDYEMCEAIPVSNKSCFLYYTLHSVPLINSVTQILIVSSSSLSLTFYDNVMLTCEPSNCSIKMAFNLKKNKFFRYLPSYSLARTHLMYDTIR